MAVELKSTVLFFNSYHIHIGICIEGTSMHLNRLHDKWKSSFIIWEEKQKRIWLTGSHSLTTHTHILAHTTGHKTPQSKHSTKHETSTNSSLFDDKTAYSTPHYRRSQSVDGVHPRGIISKNTCCEAAAGR